MDREFGTRLCILIALFASVLHFSVSQGENDSTTSTDTSSTYPEPSTTTSTTQYLVSTTTEIPSSTEEPRIIFCESTSSNNTIQLHWPRSIVNSIVTPYELCITLDNKLVTKSCTPYGWSKDSGFCSTNDNEIAKSIKDIIDSNLPVETKAEETATITENYSKFNPADVHLTSLSVQKIAEEASSGSILPNVINILSNLMKSKKTVLGEAQNTANSTDIVLYNFDKILLETKSELLSNEYLLVKVIDLRDNVRGWKVFVKDGKVTSGYVYRFEDISEDTLVGFFITEELAEEVQEKGENLIMIAAFGNDNLFQQRVHNDTGEWILGVLIENVKKLENPLEVYYRNRKGKSSCGHWEYGLDENLAAINGRWNSNNPVKNWTSTALFGCLYYHLTHFGMLVNVEVSPLDSTILNIITIIGSFLSSISIGILFLTAILFKSWRMRKHNLILLNFLLSLFLLPICLIISNLVVTGCEVFGLILHYVLLAQFAWCLIISYFQYRLFVIVFCSDINRLVLKSCLVGWLTPLGPIAIVLVINPNAYKKTETGICYLTGNYENLAVFLPMGLILVLNFYLYIKILLAICNKKVIAVTKKNNDFINNVKLGIFLFFTLGLLWIFGIVLAFTRNTVLTYMFDIMACLQGMIVSINFVKAPENVKMWKMFAARMSWDIPKWSSTSSRTEGNVS